MACWPSLVPLRLRGNLSEHAAAAETLAEQTREHPEWGVQLWASTHIGALMELGMGGTLCHSLLRARDDLERGVEVARRIGDAESESWCCWALVSLARFAGEAERARTIVSRAFELAEQLGTAIARGMAQMGLAELAIASGELDEAIRALEEATASVASDAQRLLSVERLRIEVRLARGDGPGARAAAQAVFESLLDRGVRAAAAEMALLLAAALRAEGGTHAAHRIDEVLATADRLIAETGACNLAPFVLLERAASLGDGPPRLALLERAHAEFTRMGATGRAREVARLL